MVMRLLSCGVSRVGPPGKVGDRENEVLRAFNVQHAQMRYEEGRDTSKNVWDKVGESERVCRSPRLCKFEHNT